MTRCQGNTSACTGRDLLPVRMMRAAPIIMCEGCRGAAEAMGAVLYIVERRVADHPEDRRGFVAPWRRRLRARDETGRMIA